MKKPKHKDFHHLTSLIRLTERNITGNGDYLDNYFKNQAKRLRKELEGLK